MRFRVEYRIHGKNRIKIDTFKWITGVEGNARTKNII